MKKSHKRHLYVREILLGTLLALCVVNVGIFLISGILYLIKIEPGPSFCEINEIAPPKISLKGSEIENVVIGTTYEDAGATVIHECDELEVETTNQVDTKTLGTYQVLYSSTDSKGQNTTVKRTVNVIPEYRGTIYLTFDDGPGDYTDSLLDVLAKYNVKATFFVTGRGDDATILREYKEGHTVGLHTLSHNYSYIYSSVDNFFADLIAVQDRVKNITGKTSTIMRFPGGSSNTVSRRYDGRSHIMTTLTQEVEARGFTYFDWNVLSGDAGETTDTDDVVYRVTSALHDGDNVVLQHDIKDFSVDAVEPIILYGLNNGYQFKPLTTSSFTAHHDVNN